MVIKAAQTDFDFHGMSSSHKIAVPQGLYEVGVEIPAGWYYLGSKLGETTPIVTIGTEIRNGEIKEELFDQDIGEGINLQLVEGTYISISYSAVLFEPRKFSVNSFASSRKAIIPQGIYEIGKDIPIGKYFFSGVEGETTPIVK